MYTSLGFISEAFIKRYSIPVGVIGLALTAMSTFGFKMSGEYPAYTYWATVWLLVAIIILGLISLNLSVKKINTYASSLFNIGELPPVLSICGINKDRNAKIILHPNENVYLQKDTVVSIILSDAQQGDIELGLGVITDQQPDGKIALVATPKRCMESTWKEIISNSAEYTNKMRVKTAIDRNYINDDYLYKENYEISNLSDSAEQVTTDGEGVKV